MYGIIENGALTFSEKKIKGYKEVILTDPPKTDKRLDTDWKENDDQIIQVWFEIEDSSKGGLTPDDAWKIIESSNISKENKALLKDFIYKEG